MSRFCSRRTPPFRTGGNLSHRPFDVLGKHLRGCVTPLRPNLRVGQLGVAGLGEAAVTEGRESKFISQAGRTLIGMQLWLRSISLHTPWPAGSKTPFDWSPTQSSWATPMRRPGDQSRKNPLDRSCASALKSRAVVIVAMLVSRRAIVACPTSRSPGMLPACWGFSLGSRYHRDRHAVALGDRCYL